MFTEAERAKSLSSFLEDNGVIVPFMNYPSENELHMIRIAVSASHTPDQVSRLQELLKKWKSMNQFEAV
jgi:7-keto-8-aminopelargonate synthetase-like enzyme